MRRFAWLTPLLLCALACGEEDAALQGFVVAPAGLEEQWKLLPHRLSYLDLRLRSPGGGKGWRLSARNDGGPWGAIDSTSFRMDYRVATAPALKAINGEAALEIPAGAESASQAVSVPVPPGSMTAVPLLRGLLLNTNGYVTPPDWKTSYDPAHGFTSAGLAVRLTDVVMQGGNLGFKVAVRNKFAPCDRHDASKKDDMNGAMKKAKVWITVAYTVLFLPPGALATTGSQTHHISYADYGASAPAVKQPSLAERTLKLKGTAGLSRAMVGLRGFDFTSNDDTKPVAGCAVKAKAECKGTGRYIRTLRARAALASMDSASGEAQVTLDLMFANKAADSMGSVETGTMCVQATGDVALIQLPDDAWISPERKAEVSELKSGDQVEQEINMCQGLPANVVCP